MKYKLKKGCNVRIVPYTKSWIDISNYKIIFLKNDITLKKCIINPLLKEHPVISTRFDKSNSIGSKLARKNMFGFKIKIKGNNYGLIVNKKLVKCIDTKRK